MAALARTATCVAAAWIAVSFPSLAGAQSEGDVSTIAGSGAAGLRDGAAASAEFLRPFGIAYAPNGDLYVADQAAQRIRVIRGGRVETFAGSGALNPSGLTVDGGFENGPADRARFDGPSGVAVGPDGTVYVADTNNHTIRAIRNGIVSTFAGSPQRTVATDGPLASAGFVMPRAIAVSSDGTVYVGDNGVGIRVIARNGAVTSIDLRPSHAEPGYAQIALYEHDSVRELFVAMRNGVAIYDLVSKQTIFFRSGLANDRSEALPEIEGTGYMGFPLGVVPLGEHSFAYSDAWLGSIRVVEETYRGTPSLGSHFTETIAGPQMDAAADWSGGFRDGPWADARFDGPAGMAAYDGHMVVADAGNRRIRELPPFDDRSTATVAQLAAASGRAYRIVYVGNSTVHYDTDWEHSIAGVMERRLQTDAATLHFPRTPRVFPVSDFSTLPDIASFVKEYLASGLADAVVFQLNTFYILPYVPGQKQYATGLATGVGVWQPKVAAVLSDMSQTLQSAHVPMIGATLTFSYEMSPNESIWLTQSDLSVNEHYERFEGDVPLMAQTLQRAGIPAIDVAAAMQAAEREPAHPAFFLGRDLHLSEAGNAFVGQQLAEGLERLHPWTRQP